MEPFSSPVPPTRDPSGPPGQRLQRLAPGYYRDCAFVHWTMAIDQRRTGWLDPLHHARVRELLCHSLLREHLVCACYCLMPDHGHFLIGGTAPDSRQMPALKLFRQEWNALLRPHAELQRQPFDHMLRENERERGAFAAVAQYILQNPSRAGLTNTWEAWSFSGALVPGFPRLDPRESDFWDRFWRIYGKLRERREAVAASPPVEPRDDPA